MLINSFRNLAGQKKQGHVISNGEAALAQPAVTLIVTAYNEEVVLEQKIANTLNIDYPADKLHIIFITDGSGDTSLQLVREHPRLISLHQAERKGKYAAIKRAMRTVTTPIVIFSDANTMLNASCIKNIVPHYTDKSVGGVAGEKKISRHKNISAVGEAEGIYWKYESMLKKLDADLNTVTGAAGELFSIRTSLFKEISDDLILDDFVISMQVCLQGYRIAYEPTAFAIELPSATLEAEEKRKVRISAGAYQSIGYLKECLHFFRHPLLSFQYISRRLLRWIFCPLMLILFFFTNAILYNQSPGNNLYTWAWYAQLIFYGIAIIEWGIILSGRKAGIFAIPFYFIFMNYCLIKGFFKFLQGGQTVLWEKSVRQAESRV